MTTVISACIFLKFIKIGQFFCSHFNTKDGRRKPTFLAYYALLFKKGKNVTATPKKRCVQCTEKRLCQKWFVKFHAADFLLDDIHSQADQLKLITTETLIENSVIPLGR